MPDESVSTCQSCGATIYPEHIESGIAGYLAGRQLCPFCFADAQKPAAPEEAEADAPLSLAEETPPGASTRTAAAPAAARRSAAVDASGESAYAADENYKRKLDPQSPFGTRCRTFHAKLSEGAVGYMTAQLNHWIDDNPDIVIKFATSSVGVFEGKHADLHLILTVFY